MVLSTWSEVTTTGVTPPGLLESFLSITNPVAMPFCVPTGYVDHIIFSVAFSLDLFVPTDGAEHPATQNANINTKHGDLIRVSSVIPL